MFFKTQERRGGFRIRGRTVERWGGTENNAFFACLPLTEKPTFFQGNPSSGSASPNGVVVVAKGSNGVVNGGGGDGGGGGGSGDLVDAFLLPLISILSLMLLVLVILCQRQCILDLAAPLAQQQQQQQQVGTNQSRQMEYHKV